MAVPSGARVVWLRHRLGRDGIRPLVPAAARIQEVAQSAGPTKKEQSHFVWKHRHLLVTRPEHLDGRQRCWLSQMFRYLPQSRMLRDFVRAIYRLFDPEQRPHQARCRRAALVNDPQYRADPDLAKALGMPGPEKFDKMTTFLHGPVAKRVRTNNHVERTNRRLRYFEKARYKWRRRRTIVRFLVLALERWHRQRITHEHHEDARSPKPHALLPWKQAA